MQRVIGKYKSDVQGAMLIAIGGMHGNEPAGIKAIEKLLKILQEESEKETGFKFKGTFLGLRGNLKAIEKNIRFVEKDLNRQWGNDNLLHVSTTDKELLDIEDKELLELLTLIKSVIELEKPTEILFVDLHTTSADGGIFVLVTDDPKSLEASVAIKAPVIRGLLRSLQNTTLHYFNSENTTLPTAAICFEAGQHEDPLSIDRSVAALINALISIDCIEPNNHFEKQTEILKSYSKKLPKVAEFLYSHKIQPNDGFEMKAGYQNFQNITVGEVIANDKNGPILAPYNCQILMPLYQKQGNDGFFLIKPLKS